MLSILSFFRGSVPAPTSLLQVHSCDQRFDVPECEGKGLIAVRIARNLGHVVRHHHSVVADLSVNSHGLQHVHVTVVDERFLKAQETPANVSKVDIENLAPAAEISNDV